jgi:hypothetical protein
MEGDRVEDWKEGKVEGREGEVKGARGREGTVMFPQILKRGDAYDRKGLLACTAAIAFQLQVYSRRYCFSFVQMMMTG